MVSKSNVFTGMSRLNSVTTKSVHPIRSLVTSAQGEILAEPGKIRFGILKIFAATVPGIFLGATLAKNGAAYLEEKEIFIPDEDDDD